MNICMHDSSSSSFIKLFFRSFSVKYSMLHFVHDMKYHMVQLITFLINYNGRFISAKKKLISHITYIKKVCDSFPIFNWSSYWENDSILNKVIFRLLSRFRITIIAKLNSASRSRSENSSHFKRRCYQMKRRLLNFFQKVREMKFGSFRSYYRFAVILVLIFDN